MIRLGVRSLSDFRTEYGGVSGKVQWLLTRGCSSLELLENCNGDRGVEVFEHIVRDLRISAGVFRTTARGRFQDLDPLVLETMRSLFPVSEAIEVHDWASSDALTSAEWASVIFPSFPKARVTASDLMLCLFRVSVEGERGVYISEPDGTLLQYVVGPFVCRPDPPDAALVNRKLATHARQRWNGLSARAVKLFDKLGEGSTVAAEGLDVRRLPLVHPMATALQRSDTRFRIVRHSAFEALPEPVHVVRTMNIFNKGYFSDDQLRNGAKAVLASLRPGGLWIVGRTKGQRGEHNATLFVRDGNRFTLVRRIEAGSEIESLACEASVS